MTPLLSVIIISHNQRDELIRCVDSVLNQNIPFDYEIILSDDRSKDGTFEVAQEYATKYSFIIASQCNSDECNPANNSQRSGYNRCNGYKLSKGKYIAHVDADDYFRVGANVYEKQVNALEKNTQCFLAMSTCLCVKENKSLSTGRVWEFPREMVDGEIISQREFIRGNWFRLNQCFIQRRNEAINPIELYGKRYVDSVITYHHLQYGPIVFVDACDYVYVEHVGSVVQTLLKENRDKQLLWNLGIYIPVLIPCWLCDFTMGTYYSMIRENIKMALSGYKLQPKNFNSLSDLHIWFYNCFGKELNIVDKIRLRILDIWMKIMKKFKLENKFFVTVLKRLIGA